MELFLIGVFVGMSFMYLINRLERTYGTLKMDLSNPDKDKYLFDIDNLDVLKKKKKIVLRIDPNADLSQK